MASTSASGPLTDELGRWLRPSDKMMEELFCRYDLDQSGYIDSREELEHLVFNVLYKMRILLQPHEVSAILERAHNASKIKFDLQQFKSWLYLEFGFSDQCVDEKYKQFRNGNGENKAAQNVILATPSSVVQNLGNIAAIDGLEFDPTSKEDPVAAVKGQPAACASDAEIGSWFRGRAKAGVSDKVAELPGVSDKVAELPSMEEKEPNVSALEVSEPEAPEEPRRWKAVLLISFALLGVQALLWYGWYDMAHSSIDGPAEQLIGSQSAAGSVSERISNLCHTAIKSPRLAVTSAAGAAVANQIDGLAATYSFNNTANLMNVTCSDTVCSGLTSSVVTTAAGMCRTAGYIISVFKAARGANPNSRSTPYVGLGLADGTHFDAHMNGDEVIISVRDAQNVLGQGILRRKYGVDSTTGCYNLNDFRVETDYDPRLRSWYTASAAAAVPNWGAGVYADADSGSLCISATHPLWSDTVNASSGSKVLLGIWIGDVYLESISNSLKALKPGKSGEAYIVENLEGVDFLIGTSFGTVVDSEGERLTPLQSTSPQIVDSYKHLTSCCGASSTEVGQVVESYLGNIFEGTPMLSQVPFTDATGTLRWVVVVSIPVEDYYDFVYWSMQVTAALEAVVVVIVCWNLLVACRRVPRFFFCRREGVKRPQPMVQMQNSFMIYTLVGASLWMWWLFWTKRNTDDIVKDTVNDSIVSFNERWLWMWEEFPYLTQLSASGFVLGTLPLDSPEGTNGLALDYHFSNQMSTMSGTFSGTQVAFANGDFVGMYDACKYVKDKDNCQKQIVSAVRSVDTNKELVYYNTQEGSDGLLSRNTDLVYKTAGSYSAAVQPWYKQAASADRISNDRIYGSPVVSSVYFNWGDTLQVSICQAVYTDSSDSATVAGVWMIDADLRMTSERLKMTADLKPGTVSSVMQQKGEVVASSDLVTQLESSDGQGIRLNVTISPMPLIQTYSQTLLAEFGNFEDSQGDTVTDSNFVQASRSITADNTIYSFLTEKLKAWTSIKVVPRIVYYNKLDDGTALTFAIAIFALSALAWSAITLFEYMEMASEDIREDENEYSDVIKQLILDEEGDSDSDDDEVVNPRTTGVLEKSRQFSSQDPLMVETNNLSRAFNDPLRMISPETAGSPRSSSDGSVGVERQRRFGQCVEAHYLEEVLAEDPHRLAANYLQGESDDMSFKEAHNRLNILVEDRIYLLVSQWRVPKAVGSSTLNTDVLNQRLRSKAVEILHQAHMGFDIYNVISIEGQYGEKSYTNKIFYMNHHPAFEYLMALLMILFTLAAFLTDDGTRRICDMILLTPFTVYTCMDTYLEYHALGRVRRMTSINFYINVAQWAVLLAVVMSDSSGSSSLSLLHNLLRPVSMFTKSTALRASLHVLGCCIYQGRAVFAYLFCMVSIAAIMVTVLFYKKFDPELGDSVDYFLSSSVTMFIFLTSGENWDLIVYQGYRETTLSFFLFSFLSLLGIFAIMAMVVSTFEDAFSERQHEVHMDRRVNDLISKKAAFLLLTYLQNVCGVKQLRKHVPLDQVEAFTHEWIDFYNIDFDNLCKPMLLIGSVSEHDQEIIDEISGWYSPESMQAAIQDLNATTDKRGKGSLMYEEFVQALACAKCTKLLSRDLLLASKTIWSQDLILAAASLAAYESVRNFGDSEIEDKLRQECITKELICKQAEKNYTQLYKVVAKSVGMLPNFDMDAVDDISILLLLAHLCLMSLYGNIDDPDLVHNLAAIFSLAHLFELVLRIYVMRGLTNYLNDRRGHEHIFLNKFSLFFISIASVASGAHYLVDDDYQPLIACLSALQLLRLMVLPRSFRDMTYFLLIGVAPIFIFLALLVISIYQFSAVAYYIFQDEGVSNDDGTLTFTTLEGSFLAMYQVFIGEGWHGIMEIAVNRTHKGMVWFFALYVLVVGVIFSNLFVGVLLNVFQHMRESHQTIVGTVALQLEAEFEDINSDDRDSMLIHLGESARTMFFPPKSLAWGDAETEVGIISETKYDHSTLRLSSE